MKCEAARMLMSDYLEDSLPELEVGRMREHLDACSECRSELEQLRATLGVIHRLPRQEPVIDLWEDFLPKFEQVRAETSHGGFVGSWLSLSNLRKSISEGWLIFTAVVGYNTSRKIQYLFGSMD